MNLAGFCRNCLSKWYHAASKVHGVPMEYEEACERIYGEPYGEWKKKHQKTLEAVLMVMSMGKAGEEQLAAPRFLAAFESGKDLHARTEPKGLLSGGNHEPGGQPGHSNVCGQSCDAPPPTVSAHVAGASTAARVAVLTASDRAAGGVYEDKSGPAVVEMVKAFAEQHGTLKPSFLELKVVPDDEETIFTALNLVPQLARWLCAIAADLTGSSWSNSGSCDVVLTTGGTGFGPRDVTPEATRRLLAKPAENLSRAMAWQTSLQVCGLTKDKAPPGRAPPGYEMNANDFLNDVLPRGFFESTLSHASPVLIVNLPGHPNAVR
ncbi:Molybdopterin biosynthesis protein CNX1 (Molybdenum cofactor biosynthesis enzyme CNX1) [Includes: Molybdopterin molybdenumtransferase (MPT Mo-transferase) (Domain E), partial [Durusdinium trenchii]